MTFINYSSFQFNDCTLFRNITIKDDDIRKLFENILGVL